MDATKGSTGVDAELVALRRRAYGPGGDIASDPVAQARLSELEAAMRTSVSVDAPPSQTAADVAHSTTADTTPEPEAATDAAPEPAPGGVDERPHPEAPVAAEPTVSTGPWWRSRAWWTLIGALVVVGVIVAGLVAWLTPRQPDAVLRSTGGVEASRVQDIYGSLDYFGIEADSLIRYDEFRGVEVWSGPTRFGTTCLMVTDSGEAGVWGQACAPEGLDPVVDVVRYAGFEGELFDDMPVGSLLRLIYKGDRVEVFLAPAQQIEGPR